MADLQTIQDAMRRSDAVRAARDAASRVQMSKGPILNTQPVPQIPAITGQQFPPAPQQVLPQEPQAVDTSIADRFLKGPSAGFEPGDGSGFSSPAMQAAGGPQDITPAGGEEQSEDPKPKGPTSGSFWNNPGATDSLLAFGGAMLQAPDFNTGLGRGAQAVSEAMKPHQMPNAAELARAALKAQTLRAGRAGTEGSAAQSGAQGIESGYDENGTSIPRYYDKATGDFIYVNPDGTKTTDQPAGWTPRTDTGIGAEAKRLVKQTEKDQEAVGIAYDELGRIDFMINNFEKAGGGPGVLKNAARTIADITGQSLLGVDLEDKDKIEQWITARELAEARGQRGLGQLTEGERVIIRKSLPAIHTTPEAFKEVMGTFRAAAQRKIDLYNDWSQMSPSEKRKYNNDLFNYGVAAREKLNEQYNAAGGEDEDGWITAPNGVKIREKK